MHKKSTHYKKKELQEKIVDAIKKVYDPEIPVDVYELGLIYEIQVDTKYNVYILMTLTSPNCPAAEFIPSEIKKSVQEVPFIKNVKIEITFEPPYSQEFMSEAARLALGFL